MLNKIFESELVHKMRILYMIISYRLARKLMVFAVVFVVAVVSMGTVMLGNMDLSSVAVARQETQPDYLKNAEPTALTGAFAHEQENGFISIALFALDETAWHMEEQNEPTEPTRYTEEKTWPDLEPEPEDEPESEPEPEPELRVESAAPAQSVMRIYSPRSEWTHTGDTFRYLPNIPLSEELQRYTYLKSMEIGFDYKLALALMWQESNFRAGAVNHNHNGTQDSGIMQINDVNRDWLYREMNIYNLFDPFQNIDAGMEILRRLNETHGEHFAIMAYQLGEAGMLRQVERGITTSRHVELVYQRRDRLEEMFAALDD